MHISKVTVLKLNVLGYGTLPDPPYSPDHSPTDYHFIKQLDSCLRGKIFQKEDDAENDFWMFVDSTSSGFYGAGISKRVSRSQRCLDCNGSYYDFKPEPDLKLSVVFAPLAFTDQRKLILVLLVHEIGLVYLQQSFFLFVL
ncbi:hypothetical protein RB195_005268 [Necator americanus]|uniref:Uncharacterized protein n=1 Tax=Necator americanus TaxID=51031 RepID=A0ABR1BM11_NECAM